MSPEDYAILAVLGGVILVLLVLRGIGNEVEDMQRQDEEAIHPPLVDEWADENQPPAGYLDMARKGFVTKDGEFVRSSDYYRKD